MTGCKATLWQHPGICPRQTGHNYSQISSALALFSVACLSEIKAVVFSRWHQLLVVSEMTKRCADLFCEKIWISQSQQSVSFNTRVVSGRTGKCCPHCKGSLFFLSLCCRHKLRFAFFHFLVPHLCSCIICVYKTQLFSVLCSPRRPLWCAVSEQCGVCWQEGQGWARGTGAHHSFTCSSAHSASYCTALTLMAPQ